ncbi:MAG: HAD family hydrolase, partial [Limisphaerales bacterium]
MSLPFKLLSTDFDGTLFAEFENPPVPHKLQDLIAELQAQGVKWVINTGRELSSLLEAMGRAHLLVKPDYLVLVEREIYSHENLKYVGLPEWNEACTRDHEEIFHQVRKDVPYLTDWVSKRFGKAMIYEDPYSPFCLIAEKTADAEAIHEFLDGYCARVPGLTVVRNDVYARFSHVKYNKGSALT